MKKYLSYIVAFTIILIGLSSCHTSAPRLDYKALAQASVRLGVDIELQDNHKLYIHASLSCWWRQQAGDRLLRTGIATV
jgi:lipoprotein Spr